MASHYDFYETLNDSLTHNHAPSFPQQPGGDSWQGALCPRHRQEATARFGPGHGIRCANAACPAQCCVCNLEFQPRKAVA
jgi:hypothetical protein